MTLTKEDRVRLYELALPTANTAEWSAVDGALQPDLMTYRAYCSCLHPLGVLRGLKIEDEPADWPLIGVRERFFAIVDAEGLAKEDAERTWRIFERADPGNRRAAQAIAERRSWIWSMVPERRGSMFVGSARGLSLPIYYGFPDTGFRISLDGATFAKGARRGRRASSVDQSIADETVEILARVVVQTFGEGYGLTSKKRVVHGQQVLPPCDVFCPSCNRLNHLGIPASCVDIFEPSIEQTR